jgi:hypothetical protein
MIQKYVSVLVFCACLQVTAQRAFINIGENSTAYNFEESSVGTDLVLRSRGGSFYEVGYELGLKIPKLSYIGSLTFNQFNAAATDATTSYSWQTSYVGIQNMVSYELWKPVETLHVAVKAGFNTATMVRGEQFTNNTYFNLQGQEEFSGIVLQPIVGVNAYYEVTDLMSISLGYNFSRAYNLSNSSSEKLSFTTNQIQFGLYVPIN